MILRRLLIGIMLLTSTICSQAQQINAVPDYVFRNQMSVGRNAVTDTAAYFSIGPRYGANKGFMPPIVGDTATFSSGKRNGLLIFSVQKNKFLYWDSVRVQWSDMAGSSGSYITGSGITGYVPQFSASTTLDTSALFTLGSRLGIGTTSFAYNSTSTANVELNGTSGGILGFKRNDSARGYLWHTGSDMELANTTAGSISFNTNSATRGSISSAGVWRLNNLAGTGDRVVVASSNGTLSASTSVTGLVDTTTISTRAWRQKGIDSVVSIIPAAGVGGSGTTNYIPKFTAASTIGNSQIFDNGTNVGLGTASPNGKLDVANAGDVAIWATATSAGSAGLYLYPSGGGVAQIASVGAVPLQMLTNGSERLRITSGGVVAINTQTPDIGTILHTARGSNGTVATFGIQGLTINPRIRIDASETNNTVSFNTNYNGGTSPAITFLTSEVERLRIFANGRIGVNTTTDAGYQLDINGTLRSVNGANFATNGTSHIGMGTVPSAWSWPNGVTQFRFGGHIAVADNSFLQLGTNSFYDGSNYVRVNAGYSSRYLQNDGGHFWSTAITSTAGSTVTFNEQMRMTRDGELLINTTSDAGDYKLQVAGATYQSSAAASQSVINTTNASGTSNLYQQSGSNVGWIGNGSSSVIGGATSDFGINSQSALFFAIGGYRAATINSSSEFLISTTSDAGDYKLQVAGNIYASGLAKINDLIINLNSPFVTGANVYTNGQSLAIGTQGANLMSFFTNNAERGRINSAGELLINTTSDAGDYKLQVSGDIYNTGSAVLAATSGNVGIGTASPNQKLTIQSGVGDVAGITMRANGLTSSDEVFIGQGSAGSLFLANRSTNSITFQIGGFTRMNLSNDAELFVNTTTDAGDYKLQVEGNARVGTGKLDIASNTTFGLGVARSGTSEVAGQIYNSNGILYFGAESSAGGQIFTGSSAYAAVIGSGANYPLQFATNNATRATINTGGELLINTLSDQGDYKLQVNGSVYNTGQVTRGVINAQGTGAQVFVDSTTNLSSFAGFQTLSGSNTAAFLSGNVTWNTTGNANAIDIYVTNTASGANTNFMQLGDGTNNFKVTKDASIITANPTGGTARKWRLGSAATVSPTSPNRTIQIEVDGVIYYLHAKTTND